MAAEIDTRWLKPGDLVSIRAKDPVYNIKLKELLCVSRFEVWKTELHIESSYGPALGILLGADTAAACDDLRLDPALVGKIVQGMPTLIACRNPHGSGFEWKYLKPALRVYVNDVVYF